MMEHRWYMSQRLNCDARSTAEVDWCTRKYADIGDKTHAERYAEDFGRNQDRIMRACDAICGIGKCHGKDECPLSLKVIHKLLED